METTLREAALQLHLQIPASLVVRPHGSIGQVDIRMRLTIRRQVSVPTTLLTAALAEEDAHVRLRSGSRSVELLLLLGGVVRFHSLPLVQCGELIVAVGLSDG